MKCEPAREYLKAMILPGWSGILNLWSVIYGQIKPSMAIHLAFINYLFLMAFNHLLAGIGLLSEEQT